MNHIFSIYANDLKRIGSNWAATVIILGLSILPSLYAWFNIEASVIRAASKSRSSTSIKGQRLWTSPSISAARSLRI